MILSFFVFSEHGVKTIPPSLWLCPTCSSFVELQISLKWRREETSMLENQDDVSKDMIKEIILMGLPSCLHKSVISWVS